MLYLVPTPIGNLDDMTYRAVAVLKEVDYILSEDTRTTQFLLHHYQISKEVRSFHDHNEHGKLPSVITDLQQGRTIALVSEAGMPGISDPGFLLVRACRQANLDLTVLPGPCALINALVSSGIPTEPFHFEGFLPHKKGRQTRLKYLSGLPATFILYESPHRFLKCLEELTLVCGPERQSSVCRELTKKFEEVKTASLSDQLKYFQTEGKVKGEFVIVVSGNPETAKG